MDIAALTGQRQPPGAAAPDGPAAFPLALQPLQAIAGDVHIISSLGGI